MSHVKYEHTLNPGAIVNSNWLMILAIHIRISFNANLIPTQSRGPPPKGIKAKGWWFDSMNRSGLN